MYQENDLFDLEGEEESAASAGSNRGSIILWLIVIGLAILFVPLFLVFTDHAERRCPPAS